MKAPDAPKRTRGFTLVELIVVLVILATLAALLVPSLTSYIDKARQSAVLAKARAALVASQTVVTEAYAAGKLTLDNNGYAYNAPSGDDAHFMVKEIFELAETAQDDCEWRFALATAGNTELAKAAIVRFEYCDKTYCITYLAVGTEEESAGWGQPQRAGELPKLNNSDDPPFLTSKAYDPDHFHASQ